jgi:hypothetical protein
MYREKNTKTIEKIKNIGKNAEIAQKNTKKIEKNKKVML